MALIDFGDVLSEDIDSLDSHFEAIGKFAMNSKLRLRFVSYDAYAGIENWFYICGTTERINPRPTMHLHHVYCVFMCFCQRQPHVSIRSV